MNTVACVSNARRHQMCCCPLWLRAPWFVTPNRWLTAGRLACAEEKVPSPFALNGILGPMARGGTPM